VPLHFLPADSFSAEFSSARLAEDEKVKFRYAGLAYNPKMFAAAGRAGGLG
jgi:hypothetical protein